MEKPEPKLDAGEFIVTRVVELAKLNEELKGECSCDRSLRIFPLTTVTIAYDQKVQLIQCVATDELT